MRPFLFLLLIPVAFGAYQLRENPNESVGIRAPSPVTTFVEAAPPHPEVSTANVGAWLDELAKQLWIDGVRQWEWDEGVRAAEAARVAQARVTPRSVGGTVGECTGFAIPDYIIQRESGGNPSAYNPSGAYGCAQTLLSHYSRGQCAGLDPYTIDGQRECVWRLSNGGVNLAPWAATR